MINSPILGRLDAAEVGIETSENVVQPTRIFCTSGISWNRVSDWLPIIFHFGTENWEEQLKKTTLYINRSLRSNGLQIGSHRLKTQIHREKKNQNYCWR